MKIIILAAGKSKRFKSSKHKALHDLLGLTILERILNNLWALEPHQIQLVLGHQMKEMIGHLKKQETFVEQDEQLGTAHALQVGLSNISSIENGLLVTCVDTPMISSETFKQLIQRANSQKAQIGILTTRLAQPTGYGRIIKDQHDESQVLKIIEEKDSTDEQKQINEVNTGVYFFNLPLQKLQEGLSSIKNNNNQKEYYLTDLVEWANSEGLRVVAHCVNDSAETLGINDRVDLAQAAQIMSAKRIKELQINGVSFINPSTTTVAPEVEIGEDTVIMPGCNLIGKVSIASNSVIGPNCYLQNSEIGSNCHLKFVHMVDSKIGNHCTLGPFVNIRPGTQLANNVAVGDFVEIKNSSVGAHSKLPHLSYVGDSSIGENVNIGAGTITANFDAISHSKNVTQIGDDVKVGSNCVLIAPLQIADGCMIAAGTIVTKSVEHKNSLIIARTPQSVKEDWVTEKLSSL